MRYSKFRMSALQQVLICNIRTQLKEGFIQCRSTKGSLFNHKMAKDFGDIIKIHHCLSEAPFNKEKFEFGLNFVCNRNGIKSKLSPACYPGADLVIDNIRYSLKSEAAKKVNPNKVYIAKFMELGEGEWGDNIKDLDGLLDQFFHHLDKYEKIISLRRLRTYPTTVYELVEVPKDLLLEAKTSGIMEMKYKSKQYPKPGYCTVLDSRKQPKFKIYFSGGGERKLEVKNIRKSFCKKHGHWEFKTIDNNIFYKEVVDTFYKTILNQILDY